MDIKSLTIDELTAYITDAGYPKFRAKQIYEWLHKKLVRSVDEMTNIPADIKRMISDDIVSVDSLLTDLNLENRRH